MFKFKKQQFSTYCKITKKNYNNQTIRKYKNRRYYLVPPITLKKQTIQFPKARANISA